MSLRRVAVGSSVFAIVLGCVNLALVYWDAHHPQQPARATESSPLPFSPRSIP